MSHVDLTLSEEISRSKIAGFAGQDIPWMLEQWATNTPDKTMMVWEPFTGEAVSWTYQSFAQQARCFAQGLSDRGIGKGDFVIIHLDNSPEFMTAWFACAYLGAVAVSTNTRCVARDLEYFSEHTAAVCAITQPLYAGMISSACKELRFVIGTHNDAGEAASLPGEHTYLPFDDIYADQAIALRPPEPRLNLSVQFTSGTTSRPKAVLWTHANGLWAARAGSDHLGLRRDDSTLVFLPMFHTNAQGWCMLPTVWSGGTFVLQPKFSASRFWELSMKYALTWLSTIPFTLKAVMDQPVPDHHYRIWGVGAHLPMLEQAFNVDIIGWWGMTEVLTQGIISDLHHRGAPGSMGRVAPEYDIEIRRKDGSPAAPGERGILHIRGVRGVSLFKEYYRNPEANESAFDDRGWFDTGDIVYMGEHGDLFFSDRDKDMLKVGAENVAASEIESVINQTGLVSECAVVAQKHYMLDEVPVVFVIPAPGDHVDLPDQIIAHCEENLADFKVPRQVVVVDELPRSTLEKIAKAELRARLPAIEA